MKKIITISLLSIGLMGCNATTIYNAPATAPVVAPYYPVVPYVYSYRCYSVWDQTPYGPVQRRVCGYQ